MDDGDLLIHSLIDMAESQKPTVEEMKNRLKGYTTLCIGNNPFQSAWLEMLINNLERVCARSSEVNFDDKIMLIIGRENFSNDIIERIAQYAELIVSQEEFIKYLLTGENPNYNQKDRRLPQHPGLNFLEITPFFGCHPFDRNSKSLHLQHRVSFAQPESMLRLQKYLKKIYGDEFELFWLMRRLGFSIEQMSTLTTESMSQLCVEITLEIKRFVMSLKVQKPLERIRNWEITERRFGLLRETPEKVGRIGMDFGMLPLQVEGAEVKFRRVFKTPSAMKIVISIVKQVCTLALGEPMDFDYGNTYGFRILFYRV